MIPKQNRFIGNKPIERVYKTAKPMRTGAFNIRAKKSGLEDYRLAVVVSKKVSKSAVVRNRIRRRNFEYVRKNYSGSSKISGQEIIITVFEESVARAKPADLADQLEKLFKKAGIK
jgi:ribonuclease P protein component